MIGRPASSPADWEYIREHLPPLQKRWAQLTWERVVRWCGAGQAFAAIFEHQSTRRGYMLYHLQEDELFVSGMYFEPRWMIRHQDAIWKVICELARRCGFDRFTFRTQRGAWARVRRLRGRILEAQDMTDFTVSTQENDHG